MIDLRQGDCLEVMRTLPDESVHACVTDPPYGLAFMGKKWDYDVPTEEVWREVLRVLKPGGFLLSFSGTRTYHRMVVRIEDAGFEIRDMIQWLYGSGMPKSWNFSTQHSDWCECENAVSYDHEDGQEIPEHDMRFVQRTDLSEAVNVDGKSGQVLFEGLPESGASSNGSVPSKGAVRHQQPGVQGGQLPGTGERLPNGEDARTPPSPEERLRSGAHSSSRSDTGPETGTGRGSTPHQPGPVGQQAGKSSSVQGSHGTLDEGTLRGLGCCSRCGKLRQEFKAFGTGLKPSCEPVCVARKPLVGTVAANVLAHGCGGLNIDACRVEGVVPQTTHGVSSRQGEVYGKFRDEPQPSTVHDGGRWPANVVHDGSDEVLQLFPTSDSQRNPRPASDAGGGIWSKSGGAPVRGDVGDSGSAARFFYCAKADQSERDRGVSGAAKRQRDEGRKEGNPGGDNPRNRGLQLRGNHHPTVKPVDLMRWLVRLVCPPGAVVIDPFMGSGTTGVACRLEGFGFIGIDRDEDYVRIAQGRIDAETPSLFAGAPE